MFDKLIFFKYCAIHTDSESYYIRGTYLVCRIVQKEPVFLHKSMKCWIELGN
jgi:hypothetical protein